MNRIIKFNNRDLNIDFTSEIETNYLINEGLQRPLNFDPDVEKSGRYLLKVTIKSIYYKWIQT